MSDELICGCGDGLTEGAECVNCVANYKSKLHDLGLAYENNTFYAMKFRDRIAELEAEILKLRPDAERYRWLRESHVVVDKGQISSVLIYGEELAFGHLDAAIDKARKVRGCDEEA